MLDYKINFDMMLKIVVNWSWQELYYGLGQQFIIEREIISYATLILTEKIPQYELVLELAIANEDEVNDLTKELTKWEEELSLDAIRSRWIFALIYYAYTYDNEKVFDVIDYVYTFFDYPKEIKNLIGYMPCEGGMNLEESMEDYIKKQKIALMQSK